MRRTAAIALLVLLCAPAPGGPGHAQGPSGRDWTVSGQETRTGGTLVLDENITIEAGGKLVLDGMTVLFDCASPGELSLEIRAGGELHASNTTFDWNGTAPYLLRALTGSMVTLSGCTVAHAGTCASVPELAGFTMGDVVAQINNTVFRDCAAGIFVQHDNPAEPTLAYCTFQDNDVGALLNHSKVTFDHCRFAQNGKPGAVLMNNSYAVAFDTVLDDSSVSAVDSLSSLTRVWSLDVGVFWDTGEPADGALVGVQPANDDVTYYQANSSGWASDIYVTAEYITSSKTIENGPFNISAEISGRTAWNITDVSAEMDIMLTIDMTPPEVQIDYPPDGAMLNVSALDAHGRAWDPNPPHDRPDIEGVEASVDALAWLPATGTAEWIVNISGLAEGNHTLVVRARDLAGNLNESSVRFEVDLTAPSVDVWPPSGYLTAATNITVRILSDGDSLYFNGRKLDGNIPGRPFEVNWPLDSEGNNTAWVEAWDAAGNSALRDLLAVRDTVGPSIAILSPPAYATLNSTVAVLTGACADLHGVSAVEESLDQANWTMCAGNTSWSATVLLAAGDNIVYIRASDLLGNANTSWIQLIVRLADISPPELNVESPENGEVLGSNPVEVFGSAADTSGVALVQLSLDNSTWVNATGTGGWQAELTLAPGNNTIFIRAYDRAGNVNRTSLTVSYSPPPPDTTPPSLDILYPPAGLKFTESMAVVSGKATDPSGIDLVEVSANGGNWSACIVTGEDWSGTVALSPGDNTISVRAFDDSGNQATRTVHVVFDQTADTRQQRETSIVILASAMLAVAASWLLFRHYRRQGSGGGGLA